jgi:hypothetical protein
MLRFVVVKEQKKKEIVAQKEDRIRDGRRVSSHCMGKKENHGGDCPLSALSSA